MKHPTFPGLAMVLSIVVWLIGMVVIFGFLMDIDHLQNWIGKTPMASETAICFVMVAVTLYLLALDQMPRHPPQKPPQ